MEKDDFYYFVMDAYYDRCALVFAKDLNHPDPEVRARAEYMVKAMEEEKLYTHTAVEDPFVKGHSVVVRHRRGEPRKKVYFEEQWEKLSLLEKLRVIARKHMGL